MGIKDRKITAWTNPIVNEADTPQRTASEMKAVFDSNSNQLMDALNTLIDDLCAPGCSGDLGAASFGDIEEGTVLSQLMVLRDLIDQRVASLEVGAVETGPAGSKAQITITGELPNLVINFVIPKGDPGDATQPHAKQHARDGDDPIAPESIGAADEIHYHDGVYQRKLLQFSNSVVAVSLFVADSTYPDYPFSAAVILEGVESSMIPEVIFSPADASSGIYAPVAMAYDGGIYIYAAKVPEANLTIPSILIWR